MSCDHSYQGGPYGPSMEDLDERDERLAEKRFMNLLNRIFGDEKRDDGKISGDPYAR
ncbi:MAG: hypothetical protein Q7R91_00635 [bacterium]|nr:hypothetical protein [bacterium]